MLVTRPEPGASETAARLAALGFVPVLAPVMTIVPQPLKVPPGRPQAVLVSSGNAIASLPESVKGLKLLAVGDATAARARGAGFRHVHSAAGDAAALTELAATTLQPAAGPLLLASGNGQSVALAAALRAHGFSVLRRVAYATRPAERLATDAHTALRAGNVRAALFFSPRSARIFVTIVPRDLPAGIVQRIEALAISPATAAALKGLQWRRVRVASQPNQEELLKLLQ